MALQAYRNLMRAASLAFKNDAPTLLAAKDQIRSQFRQDFTSQAQFKSTDEALEHADGVAKILRENVVQGAKQEGTDNTYKLRIHEQTERGDNDSILTAGAGATLGGCGCK